MGPCQMETSLHVLTSFCPDESLKLVAESLTSIGHNLGCLVKHEPIMDYCDPRAAVP